MKFVQTNSRAWSSDRKSSSMQIKELKFCDQCLYIQNEYRALCKHPDAQPTRTTFVRSNGGRPNCSSINIDGNCQLYEEENGI